MLYKLIVLYMLEKADISLSSNQIINFVLDKGYTDYITMQQVIGELIEDEFIISLEDVDLVTYSITDNGTTTLKMFSENISSIIREEIDTYIRENKYKFLQDKLVTSNYTTEINDEYRVYLAIVEANRKIFELSIVVPTEELAKSYCKNWKKKSSDIYKSTLTALSQSKLDHNKSRESE